MEKQKLPLTIAAAIVLAVTILFSGFLFRNPRQPEPGQIYLYGEVHAQTGILEKELEIWEQHYQEDGMRHLFVELPYYTTELLNLWMQEDNDRILDQIYEDWKGTQSHSPNVKVFYQEIKKNCPETVFHGTDVGHQRGTTDIRYLGYLEEHGQKDSENYRLAQKSAEQGAAYYAQMDEVYRENCLVENFIAEYNRLIQAEGPTDIMGIYGAAHTNPDSLDFTGQVPSMASQIKERYGEHLHSENLSRYMLPIVESPLKVETIQVNGKEYKASYFGKVDLSADFKEYQYREYWRLENAYEDVKKLPISHDVLPSDNFPMLIEDGQVFIIDYTTTAGEVIRKYYRTDGNTYEGMPCANEFLLEE